MAPVLTKGITSSWVGFQIRPLDKIHCLLDVPTGRLIITMLAAIAEFERGSAGAPARSFMLRPRMHAISSFPATTTAVRQPVDLGVMVRRKGCVFEDFRGADRPSDR